MTTATMVTHGRTMDIAERPRRSLEELVDQLMAAMFKEEPAQEEPSATWTIHEARRLRQAGDIDGALTVLAGMDTAKATTREARWAFSEWSQMARRQFGNRTALVYNQGAGRAAVLVPKADALLEVAAVLGLRWKPGKAISRRSLRGPPLVRALTA